VHDHPKMDLATRNVVAVFGSFAQTEAALAVLREAGVAAQDVSIVGKRPGDPPEVGARDTHASSGGAVGGAVGAAVGGLIGLAALAVPGVGPLLAAGAIGSALTGAAAGGFTGAMVGSFLGLGVPTEHGQRYEEAVRSGAVVLTVQVPNEEEGTRARGLLEQAGAQETAVYQPALSPRADGSARAARDDAASSDVAVEPLSGLGRLDQVDELDRQVAGERDRRRRRADPQAAELAARLGGQPPVSELVLERWLVSYLHHHTSPEPRETTTTVCTISARPADTTAPRPPAA
jgi:hypothetical protein